MNLVRSWRLPSRLASLLLAGLAVTACSDDSTEPDDRLTSTQRQNLLIVLQQEAVARAFFQDQQTAEGGSLFLQFVANNLQRAGSVTLGAGSSALAMNRVPRGLGKLVTPSGTYHTFAVQAILTVKEDGADDINMVWTGVMGVNSLDSPSSVFVMGALDNGTTTAPTSIDPTQVGVDGNRTVSGGFVQFHGNDEPSLYLATDGHFALSSFSVSGSSNCSGIAVYFFVESCSRNEGTAAGSFSLSGPATQGEESVTISNSAFDLPAIRMTMVVDITFLEQPGGGI
jgi:hypothetical protein